MIISNEVVLEAKECALDYSCLSGEKECLCDVEEPSNGIVLFVTPANKRNFCCYRITFGDSFICNCPVRKEIFNRYSI
ncbi:MAG: hypothetical protein HY809_03090 [Nitrospirae bacterium]|nr:hypothetical protein [Nitrospirota bacterium]